MWMTVKFMVFWNVSLLNFAGPTLKNSMFLTAFQLFQKIMEKIKSRE